MVKKARICGILGVAALVFGVALIVVLPKVIDMEIKKVIPLKVGSIDYDKWKNPSDMVPIYFQLWVFDLKNPSEVVNEGKRPVVEQKGPYTYHEKWEKVNITFNDNGTVTYRQPVYYIFDRHLSVGPENDTFTTVSLPMLAVATILRYEYDLLLEIIQALYDSVDESLFIKMSVHDIMWGYEDNLLKATKSILAEFNLSLPISDKFGLFYQKNGSDLGEYTVFTGETDASKLTVIDRWNGMSSLPYWSSNSANMINGTDGMLHPPLVDKSQPQYLFSSQISRSIYGNYIDTTSFEGIDIWRFMPPKSTFANATINPANAGFCTPHGNCLDSGVLNVSALEYGAPGIISWPHFNEAAQQYIDAIEGMHPNPEQHTTYWEVEPLTGVVFNMNMKLQVNVYIERIRHIRETQKFSKPLIYPVLWFNESVLMTTESADWFKDELFYLLHFSSALKYGVTALGAIIIIIVFIHYTSSFYKRKNSAVETNGAPGAADKTLKVKN